MNRDFYGWYGLVGLLYWAFNLVVRKLHKVNENGEGWFLSLFWVFGWPLCWAMLIAGTIRDRYIKFKNKV